MSTFIGQLIGFAVIVFLLVRFVVPPVRRMMTAQQETVRRQLEEPSTKPEVFTDAKGNPTPVPAMNNDGVNGVYLTSEGKKGAEAWGTRARWCAPVTSPRCRTRSISAARSSAASASRG